MPPRRREREQRAPARGTLDWLRGASASDLSIYIATTVLWFSAYSRHGLTLSLAYLLAIACLWLVDHTLHSLQLLNLAAVVYDLSFELHRLYTLVSQRPLLMIAIMLAAIVVEYVLERYEAEDAADTPPRTTLGNIGRLGRSVGRMLLPALMGVLSASRAPPGRLRPSRPAHATAPPHLASSSPPLARAPPARRPPRQSRASRGSS